jgi:hypothetical protein
MIKLTQTNYAVFGKTDTCLVLINPNRIDCIENFGNYNRITLSSGYTVNVSETLEQIDSLIIGTK